MSDTIPPVYAPSRSVAIPTVQPGSVAPAPFTDLAWNPKGTAESNWWWIDATAWCTEIDDVIGQGSVAVVGPDTALLAVQLNWTAYPTMLGILLQGGTPGGYYTVCPKVISSKDVNVCWAGEVELEVAGSISYLGDPSLTTNGGDVVLLGGVPFPTGTEPTGPVEPATEMQSMPALNDADLPNAQFPVLLPPLAGSNVARLALASSTQVGGLAPGGGDGGDEQAEITALQVALAATNATVATLSATLTTLTSVDEINLTGQTAQTPYQAFAALSIILSGTGFIQVSSGVGRAILNGTGTNAPVLPPTGSSWGDVGTNTSVYVPAGQMVTFSVLSNGICVADGA